MNTAENSSCLERLRLCYSQLSEAVQSEMVSPDQIIVLSDTAEKIIAELKNDSSYRAALQPEEVSELKQQADDLIRLIQDQMDKLTAQLSGIRSGRRAVKGYQPFPNGMGFSEGKFMDTKK